MKPETDKDRADNLDKAFILRVMSKLNGTPEGKEAFEKWRTNRLQTHPDLELNGQLWSELMPHLKFPI